MLDKENKEFAYAFLSDRESYHSQKENMANAIFVVEVSLFGALTTSGVVTDLLQGDTIKFSWLVLFVVMSWFLLHIFMRWQLRNRRIASLQTATLLKSLADNLTGKNVSPERKNLKSSKIDNVLDYFIPRPKSTFLGDTALSTYPKWYQDRYQEVQGEGTGASFGEIFPTYGSIIMMISSVLYIFLSSP